MILPFKEKRFGQFHDCFQPFQALPDHTMTISGYSESILIISRPFKAISGHFRVIFYQGKMQEPDNKQKHDDQKARYEKEISSK